MSDLVTRVRRRMASDPGAVEELIRAEHPGITDESVFAALRKNVEAELVGAGPLEELLALPGVTDVLVTAADAVWIDRGRGLERTPIEFADDAAVRRLAVRLVAAAGRRLDDAVPFADAALPDGTRLHAVLPPLVEHPTLSLRVLSRTRLDLEDLLRLGAFPAAVGELLHAVLAARLGLLISGGTGAGKTTLLGALLGTVPGDERLLVVEDSRELVVRHPHVVRLMTRAANIEGEGDVDLRELVRLALRMRPDRIVVGEFRGAETADLLLALNTGHDGGAATVHANSAADVPARLLALGSLGGLTPRSVAALAATGLDVVVHVSRRGRARHVSEIGALALNEDRLEVQLVWSLRDGSGAAAAALAARLAERGGPVPQLLR
jgi:pilus assembly protein CpaF